MSWSLDGLQWKYCGRNSTLKIPAAYGPVLRKISKCHTFCNFWQIAKKSDNLYEYDLDESDENCERSRALKNCKIRNLLKCTEWPQTKLKQSGIKSTLDIMHCSTPSPKFSYVSLYD